MIRRKRRKAASPLMLAQLTVASWEVVGRRSLMALTNTCSPAEYRRMVREKKVAALASAAKFVASGGTASMAALLAPWHGRATSNVKRLRKKG